LGELERPLRNSPSSFGPGLFSGEGGKPSPLSGLLQEPNSPVVSLRNPGSHGKKVS
jgi:hypothetical protein